MVAKRYAADSFSLSSLLYVLIALTHDKWRWRTVYGSF